MTNFIQFFKRNIEIIIINLLFLTFALLVFYLTGNKKEGNKEVAIAILVTGISLSIGIKQLQIENDKIFKELFTNFNSVYDAKFNNTLNRIDSNYKNKNTYILNEDEKLLIIDYLNFCAEEYLWYKKNRIDENVWKSWKNGMLYFMNIPVINEFVLNQKEQANSYYGLFSKIGKNLENWK